MEQKFREGDIVRVGHPSYGYDLARVEHYYPNHYELRIITRNQYFSDSNVHESVNICYYTYPLENWVMEYPDNALQRLKKRYAKQV
jgi:hypothetical protein